MNPNIYVVIMAGGIGTRFWPYSRIAKPKQFQDILGVSKSLLQITAQRFENICPTENIYIVTNESYYGLVKEQLSLLTDDQVLLEPFQRNTAPCIAYACYKIRQKNEKAVIIVAPADHHIQRQEEFEEVVGLATEAAAEQDILVTLGITPTYPNTGYGYIQMEDINSETRILKVRTFTEKPNLAMAIEFLDSGDFVWNAGLFIWRVDTIIKAFEKYIPKIAEVFQETQKHFFTVSENKAVAQAYSQCHNISIDYAVMEKADNVYVVPCQLGWSDLGTWRSLFDVLPKNKNKNVAEQNILEYETRNCLIKVPKDKLVVVQGLENYIVVEHDNVLLICHKNEEQRIKQFLEDAQKTNGNKFS